MKEQEIIELLTDAMELDEEIRLDDLLSDYEEWDSLSILTVIMNCKSQYGCNIPFTDVQAFKTGRDIYNYLVNNAN